MAEPFVPHQKEETVTLTITKREAVLLQKLRKYAFGKFVVHKMNGILLRIEATESQVIDGDTEIEKW